jgi:hypothetical protein
VQTYVMDDLMPDTLTLRAWKTGYDDVDQRVTLNADFTCAFYDAGVRAAFKALAKLTTVIAKRIPMMTVSSRCSIGP